MPGPSVHSAAAEAGASARAGAALPPLRARWGVPGLLRLEVFAASVRSSTTARLRYKVSDGSRITALSVCHRGGPETDPGEFESVKLAGCAPLIFFFYSYGRQKAV